MTPRPPRRPYSPVERQQVVDAGRARILDAALAVLQRDPASVSLEAVARKAGVTRMTVYNQFGSKAGLLEQLFDQLVTRGAFEKMPAVFAESDPVKGFDVFASILGRFYTDNRSVLSRMRAAAGQDPDLDAAMRKRNERRRRGVETLVQRLDPRLRFSVPDEELVNTLEVLLSFNTYDALAGPSRTPDDVAPLVRKLIKGVLTGPRPGRPRRRQRRQRRA